MTGVHSKPLTADLTAKMVPLLNVIEQVRELVKNVDSIQIPQIAVIGVQSAGKSAVIERIARIRLPSKAGLCTRTPLIIKMQKMDSSNQIGDANQAAEKGTEVFTISYYVHEDDGKRMIIMEDVQKDAIADSIVEITDKIAPAGEIVDNPITLTVQSPNVENLTLVDLPGLIEIAGVGQSDDLPKKVKAMVKRYIMSPSTINLCVLAGTDDISNSKALRLVREYDKSGRRSIGVLTKTDQLLSNFEEKHGREQLAKILRQQVAKESFRFKHGMIALRNRTAKENQLSFDALSVKEKALGDQNLKDFAELRDTAFGVANLTSKLASLLAQHTLRQMQPLVKEIRTQLKSTKDKLKALSEWHCPNESDAFKRMTKQVYDLQETFGSIVQGERPKRLDFKDQNARSENVWLMSRIAKCVEQLDKRMAGLENWVLRKQFEDEIIREVLERCQGTSIQQLITSKLVDEALAWCLPHFKEPLKEAHEEVRGYIKDCIRATLKLQLRSSSCPRQKIEKDVREYVLNGNNVSPLIDAEQLFNYSVLSHVDLHTIDVTNYLNTLNTAVDTQLSECQKFANRESSEQSSKVDCTCEKKFRRLCELMCMDHDAHGNHTAVAECMKISHCYLKSRRKFFCELFMGHVRLCYVDKGLTNLRNIVEQQKNPTGWYKLSPEKQRKLDELQTTAKNLEEALKLTQGAIEDLDLDDFDLNDTEDDEDEEESDEDDEESGNETEFEEDEEDSEEDDEESDEN